MSASLTRHCLFAFCAALLLCSPAAPQDDCEGTPSIEVVGEGTPGAQGVPVLSTEGAPLLGLSINLRVSNGARNSLGFLLYSAMETPVFLHGVQGTLYPGEPLQVRVFQLDAAGVSPKLLTLPSVPELLCGGSFVFQAVVIDPAAQRNRSLTPALRIQFGPVSAGLPQLDALPERTAANQVTLSGRGLQGGNTLRIEGGAQLVEVASDASGLFSVNVPLKSNTKNQLFVREVFPGGLIGPPSSATVVQDQTPPELVISFPEDGAVFSSGPINVSGVVSDALSGASGLSVSVNGQPATVDMAMGTNATFVLNDFALGAGGPVSIQVSAQDVLGNTTLRSVNVQLVAPLGGTLVAQAGDNQSALVGSELAQPLVARTLAANGSALSGKPVTFRVTKSDGRLASSSGGPGALTQTVLSDAQGEARVFWTLGSDAGSGNNRVRASSASLEGAAYFNASASADPSVAKLNLGMGNEQMVQAGTLTADPLRVWVNDGRNPLPGTLVEFRIASLHGSLLPMGGGGTPTRDLLVAAGPTGHAEALVLTDSAGGVTLVETRLPGSGELPVVFKVYGLRPELDATRVAGLVHDNSMQPVQGVPVELHFADGNLHTGAVTDADGRFVFEDVPFSGHAEIVLDGASATHVAGVPIDPAQLVFPHLGMAMFIVEHGDNVLQRAMNLPRLDPADVVTYDGSASVELRMPGVEGLVIHVPQGTVVHHPGGALVTSRNPIDLSVSPVHVDEIPMPLPDGTSAPLAWTMQPGGSHFDPPLRIELPNMSGLPAGAVSSILVFDHGTGSFEIVAPATVSDDATLIVSDPGFGIHEAGWAGFGGFAPPPTDLKKAPGSVWTAITKTGKAITAALSVFSGVGDKVKCAVDIVSFSSDLADAWSDAKFDGEVSAAEASSAAALAESLKSTAVQCLAAIAPGGADDPCETVAVALEAVGALNALINASAATTTCLKGTNTTVADLDNVANVGLTGLGAALTTMCDKLKPKDIALKVACVLLKEIAGVLALSSDSDSRGGSAVTPEEIAEVDALLAELELVMVAMVADDDEINAILDTEDALVAVLAEVDAIDADLKPEDSPLDGAVAMASGAFGVVDLAGGVHLTNLLGPPALTRMTFVKTTDGVVEYAQSSYQQIVGNNTVGFDEDPVLSTTPPLFTVGIDSFTSSSVLTSPGEQVMIQTDATFSDESVAPVAGFDDGVLYTSSSPNVLSIDADGVATAHASGVVFVTVSKDGTASSLKLQVALGDPLTSVQGQVVDAASQPIVGAEVTTSAGFASLSGALGAFSFDAHTTSVSPLRLDARFGVGANQVTGFSLGNLVAPAGVTQVGQIVLDVDSDGDQLPDWYETNLFGSDPGLADSDGDGLSDGAEVLQHGTHPGLADTDGDGFDDGLEIDLGSDALATDAPTTLAGRVELPGRVPAAGATLVVKGVPAELFSAVADGGGFFSFADAWPASLSPVVLRGTLNAQGVGNFAGDSLPTETVASAVTDVPVFELASLGAGPLFPNAIVFTGGSPTGLAVGDLDQDGVLDFASATNNARVTLNFGNGDGTYSAPQQIVVGGTPGVVEIGDFNLDGLADLAVAYPNSVFVSVLLGTGGGAFAPQVDLVVGAQPQALVLADLNGDGALDIATANLGTNGVSVLLNAGDGSFAASQAYAAASFPSGLDAGDVNQDGFLDLVVTNINSHNVSVLLGFGDGSFAGPLNFATGLSPVDVAVADYDQDGLLDLAVVNSHPASRSVSVLTGNGDGTFSPLQEVGVLGVDPDSIAVADQNQDGVLDLAVSNRASGTVAILVGQGNGTFGFGPQTFAVGSSPSGVVLTDMDQDGLLDLVVANLASGGVSVLPGNGDATYPQAPVFGVGNLPVWMASADLDADGNPDLVTANSSGNNVSVALGLGDGSFGAAQNFGAGVGPEAVAIADLNLDGDLDLAVANFSSGNVSILLGGGDGSFGAAQNFVSGTSSSALALADLNADSAPDLVITTGGFAGMATVLLGAGDGSFGAPQSTAVGPNPNAVAIADLDQDGNLDLAITVGNASKVSVLLGAGDGSFAPPQDTPVGSNPAAIAIADLDGDGALDLIVGRTNAQVVGVLFGTGDGSFAAPVEYASAGQPAVIVVADVDADGNDDLALALRSANTAAVLFGAGDGSFGGLQLFSVGATPEGLAVADFDQDGKLDLALANRNTSNVTLLINQQ